MNQSFTKPHDDEGWVSFIDQFRSGAPLNKSNWKSFFGPLQRCAGKPVMVVGQLGQSLDGRIATVSGNSKYINGTAGLNHLHRLRALMDGVLIGVSTALADDPLLTVRRVQGPQPARIVIDPSGKLPADAQVWSEDGARRIVITASGAATKAPAGVERIPIYPKNDQIEPGDVINALSDRGLKSILVEGGANTITRFLSSGQLDRLHLIVAPLILGSGRNGLNLKQIERVDQALKPVVTPHILDDEVLFDCDFKPSI